MPSHPLPNSYFAPDTRHVAGELPGAIDPADADRRLAVLLDVGVQAFVDLTTTEEGLGHALSSQMASRGDLPRSSTS